VREWRHCVRSSISDGVLDGKEDGVDGEGADEHRKQWKEMKGESGFGDRTDCVRRPPTTHVCDAKSVDVWPT
jgi:hypothetical protein